MGDLRKYFTVHILSCTQVSVEYPSTTTSFTTFGMAVLAAAAVASVACISVLQRNLSGYE